ncbi:NACHT, LRR and PYD domains-containing protein 3-like isoform X2 [Ranitomeya imitator]|uniref:NACHT, LRR and PYD domains-containing protein 3-like isoform X2 n=1 Tax=Ranitomeya imitator TaxID=111125 RepID=UPI0037E8A84E
MSSISPNDDYETRQFYLQLCQYEDNALMMIHEYFQDDLHHIVENLNTQLLFSELIYRNIHKVKKYKSKKIDRKTLARKILQDIYIGGREAMIGLWVSLYVLHRQHNFSSVEAALDELSHRGDSLMEEILLDKHGHQLTILMKDAENFHKKHLHGKTEKLKENNQQTWEQESFLFATRFVKLSIISTQQFREYSENEYQQTGIKLEEYLKKKHNVLQHLSPNKLFRWCHRSRVVPHMVLVIGVPGVGKTTLMQKFVYDWVRGDLYQRFSFVFFFKFQDLNRLDKISLENLILHEYPHLEQQLENILQNPGKLLFIFDGLDKSLHTMDFTSRHLCSHPKQPEYCGQIVVSLVRKSLLNGCSVLMTSRPTRLASTDSNVFQRTVEIIGFFPEERQMYFQNFFSNPELAEKAFTYVKQNEMLYRFCYLPSYCWIICTLLSKSFQPPSSDQPLSSDQPESLLPKTVTQLFAIFISNILSNHNLHKSDAQRILKSVGWMAEHGVMNHRVIFDERDLSYFHVDKKSELLSRFLIELDKPGTYSFLNLTVQEFFSALVHYVDYSPEKLQKSLYNAKSYSDGRGEIFLRFLCGLSDNSTRLLLAGYLDSQAAQASRDVITWMKNFIHEEQRLGISEDNQQRLLKTFFCLFETRNKALVLESLILHSFELSYFHMSSLYCTVLAYTLETCTNLKEFILSGCSLDNEGLEILASTLLFLQNLRLVNNDLSDTACIQLASGIKNNQSLKILDLTNNRLFGPHFKYLTEALSSPECRIEELLLANNHLPDISCIELASGIKKCQSLKKIDLSGNSLSGYYFAALEKAMSSPDCKIEELRLLGFDLSAISCNQLASVIKNTQSLKILDLSYNHLVGSHFNVLMEALSSPECRIQELQDFTIFLDSRKSIITPRDDPEIRQLYLQLCQYKNHALWRIHGYFQEDLICIVEKLNIGHFLDELHSRYVCEVSRYESLEKDRKTLARTLLQDIYDKGRAAVIGLWASLYVLQKRQYFPSLHAVLEELRHRGNTLVEQIIMDEEGHHLPPELKVVQNTHKKHLYERTEKLVENKPPRSNQQEESFQFSTRYVNLIIVSTNHFRQRSENELIELGKKHEEYLKKSQYELQHIFPNKLFRWYHESNLVPHMVMVIGVPGVGKTTLMQKFVYDWGRKVLYQRFSFVFFFKFRELNRLDNISVETMILHQYPHLEEQLEDIFQDPEKLLFIFDGLDESFHEVNFTSHHLCSNPKQPKPCGQIVVSLVRKSLLKGCSVLMTSRPTRLTSIDHSVFQRKIEIIGFFPEERQMYFENFFSNPEMTEKAFSYVKQNETLYTFCYLPSYCWIICTVLSRSFQTTSSDQPVLLPKTVTQLFAIFIANILANHSLHKSDAQEILRSIGWMAEHGVMNRIIIFDDQDLDAFHVDKKSKLLSSFLMESAEPVSYSFLHLTVQEFFSALVHYVDYSPVKLQKSLYNATSYSDGRGEMFLRFLFGLSDNSTRSILTGYLDPQAAQASINVITWVKNFIVDKQRQSITNKQHLLSIFFYMYESRNKALVLELLQSHRKLDFSGVHMSSLDCMVLAFILEICTNIEELNFSRCCLDIEGLDRLASVLHNLKNLRLDDNDLTDISCIQLASITRNNRSLNKLDLSDNRLSGPHLSNLMEALSSPDCRIEELRLANNHLQDTSCTKLASGIRNNQYLKKLDLSVNSLSGLYFGTLMEALSNPNCNIKELCLAGNGLPETSCIHLSSGIWNNRSLEILDLSNNRLSGPHFSVLMEALSSPDCGVKELLLAGNYLTDASCKHLATAIWNNQSLKKLVLSNNQLFGDHFSDLMGALSSPDCRIEDLRLDNNDLPDISCIQLASGIRNNRSLKTLVLSYNHLSGPHLSDLLEALSSPDCRIDTLEMVENEFSEEQNKEILRKLITKKPYLNVNLR